MANYLDNIGGYDQAVSDYNTIKKFRDTNEFIGIKNQADMYQRTMNDIADQANSIASRIGHIDANPLTKRIIL